MPPKRKVAKISSSDIEDAIPEIITSDKMKFMRQLNIMKKWKEGKVADVDVYGCDTLAEAGVEPKVRRFQVLVGLLLSSQTKDPITAGAVRRLQSTVGLTPAKIRAQEEEVLAELIKPVGFYRMKAGYLKKIAGILGEEEYEDDIPVGVEELIKLPGIGPKMAYLTMQSAWGQCVGIGVDVHVHRVSGRLGWTTDSKTPEETRVQLEKVFPREEWAAMNHLVISFGQLQCLPVKPKCEACPLKEECKFGNEIKSGAVKKSKSG